MNFDFPKISVIITLHKDKLNKYTFIKGIYWAFNNMIFSLLLLGKGLMAKGKGGNTQENNLSDYILVVKVCF